MHSAHEDEQGHDNWLARDFQVIFTHDYVFLILGVLRQSHACQVLFCTFLVRSHVLTPFSMYSCSVRVSFAFRSFATHALARPMALFVAHAPCSSIFFLVVMFCYSCPHTFPCPFSVEVYQQYIGSMTFCRDLYTVKPFINAS